jgi:hypothetical protein
MNCLVVLSFSAIETIERPLLSNDHTVFCFWLRGDAKVQLALMNTHGK